MRKKDFLVKLCVITDWDIPESDVAKYKKNLKAHLNNIFREDFLPDSLFDVAILASANVEFLLKDYFKNQDIQIFKTRFLSKENFVCIKNNDNQKDFLQDYDALILIKDKTLGQLAPRIYAFEKLGKFCISFNISD